MDYKYIEQLLERYFECQTTLEEESILRSFFSQDDVPASMLPLRDLFLCQKDEKEFTTLGDDFDTRLLAQIEQPTEVKARRITLTQRLMPLFKAVAIVAIVLSVGGALEQALDQPHDIYVGVSGSGTALPGAAMASNSADTLQIDSLQRTHAAIPEEQAAPF